MKVRKYESQKDFNLWDMLSENDLVSKWAVFYVLLNDERENEYLRNLIFNYAKSGIIGRNRIGLYLE